MAMYEYCERCDCTTESIFHSTINTESVCSDCLDEETDKMHLNQIDHETLIGHGYERNGEFSPNPSVDYLHYKKLVLVDNLTLHCTFTIKTFAYDGVTAFEYTGEIWTTYRHGGRDVTSQPLITKSDAFEETLQTVSQWETYLTQALSAHSPTAPSEATPTPSTPEAKNLKVDIKGTLKSGGDCLVDEYLFRIPKKWVDGMVNEYFLNPSINAHFESRNDGTYVMFPHGVLEGLMEHMFAVRDTEMYEYEIKVTRSGKMFVKAPSEEALNARLFEEDDYFFDYNLNTTDWEIIGVKKVKEDSDDDV